MADAMELGKKVKKCNGFFLFMVDKRREFEGAGRKFRGYAEIAPLIDADWQNLDAEMKEDYKKKAKAYNEKYRGPSESSLNFPQLTELDVFAARVEKIWNFDWGNQQTEKIIENYDSSEIPIVLINFSLFWESLDGSASRAIPAEVGMNVFSMQKGIYDNMFSLIDPGTITNEDCGRRVRKAVNLMKKNAKILGMPYDDIDYSEEFQDYKSILKKIGQFVKLHSVDYFDHAFVFCLESEMAKVEACLKWLSKRSGERVKLEILNLNLLMCLMSNEIDNESLQECTRKVILKPREAPPVNLKEMKAARRKKELLVGDIVVRPSQIKYNLISAAGVFTSSDSVEEFLKASTYSLFGEIGCTYHMEIGDKVDHCPLNAVNRYAYCLMDVLIPSFKVIPQLGFHYPDLNKPEVVAEIRQEMLKKWLDHDYSYYAYIYLLRKVKEEQEEEE